MLTAQIDRRLFQFLILAATLFWLNIGFSVLSPATGSFILKWIPSAILAFLVFRHRTSNRSFLLFCALLVQSAGAVILDFDRTGYVLYSLGFTALAHALFASTFWPGLAALRRLNRVRYLLAGLLLVYAILYGGFIGTQVPSRMFLPVTIYMTVLTTAAAMSVLSGASPLLALGMALFVIDDTVFSWHLFVSPIPANHFITWPAYIAGQTLVTLGFLREGESN